MHVEDLDGVNVNVNVERVYFLSKRGTTKPRNAVYVFRISYYGVFRRRRRQYFNVFTWSLFFGAYGADIGPLELVFARIDS